MTFPLVCGHEFVGEVQNVGSRVTKHKIGDKVGVGCFVSTCRNCEHCERTANNYCRKGTSTYNSKWDVDGKPTYGGYSQSITINEDYAVKVGDKLDLSRCAPLLCAGITLWSPMKKFKNINSNRNIKFGIVGLGGLGHMGIKFGKSFGWNTTVFSTSPNKRDLSLGLGADNFLITTSLSETKEHDSSFDFIIDTVSADHDLSPYFRLLKANGTFCVVGLGGVNFSVPTFPLIVKGISFVGSCIGSINEAQEMMDYCNENNIVSDVEVVSCDYVNKAFERLINNDVKFRFVLNIGELLNDNIQLK